MRCLCFTDGPDNYDNPSVFTDQGSNPTISDKLFTFIDDNIDKIESIRLAMYLFNNAYLLDKIENYIARGINVDIVSIPIEGYDASYPRSIIDHENGTELGKYTKQDLAQDVYRECSDLASSNDYFSMYVFPHMYIRSERVKPFSRGNLPYSLHIKSIVINYKDGSGAYGLTSSNLAVRDETKDNILLLVDEDTENIKVANEFFDNLINNSIYLPQFDENKNYFEYEVKQSESHFKGPHTLFIAPFYKESPHIARDFLIDLISEAKHHIFVCAQHVAAYNYYEDGKRVPGVMDAVIKAAERGVEVSILSQTFVDSRGYSHGQRRPANIRAFQDMMSKIENTPNIKYYSNPTVHSKFIIVDDRTVVTTCNFTPTEFIYLPDVNIRQFDNIPGLTYKGIFSEVGQYIYLKNDELANRFISIFKNITNRSSTYRHQ